MASYGMGLGAMDFLGGGRRRERMLGLRTGIVASGRAAAGPNLDALGRNEGARRQQMAALSQGTGAPPLGFGGPQLHPGSTYAINPTAPGMSFTGQAGGSLVTPGAVATEVPGERAAWGQPGLEGLGEGMGYARLSDSYKTPEQIAKEQQTQGAAFQQSIASPYGRTAVAGLRSGTMGGNIEDIANRQAAGGLGRAQAIAGVGVAPQMAQAGLERTQVETRMMTEQANLLGAMAKQAASGSVQARQAVQDAMDSAIASGAPLEVIAALRDIQMGQFGMRQVPPGVLEQVYAILRPYAALLGGMMGGPLGAVAGSVLPGVPAPRYQPAPTTRAEVMTAPPPAGAVAGTRPVAGAAAGTPTTADKIRELARVRDEAEAELQRLQRGG